MNNTQQESILVQIETTVKRIKSFTFCELSSNEKLEKIMLIEDLKDLINKLE